MLDTFRKLIAESRRPSYSPSAGSGMTTIASRRRRCSCIITIDGEIAEVEMS